MTRPRPCLWCWADFTGPKVAYVYCSARCGRLAQAHQARLAVVRAQERRARASSDAAARRAVIDAGRRLGCALTAARWAA